MSSTVLPPSTEVNYFHIVDYIVLGLMLLLSLAIGVYYAFRGNKQTTTSEYFRGGSNMSMFPVVMSLIATFVSSNGMLGVPAEVYYYGANYFFTSIGIVLGVPISTYFFLPVFYDLKITSINEYLEKRFNKAVRICGSLMALVSMLLYASFVTYGPALALSQVTGLSLWGSILTTTVIGTVYTSIGGIKAVIWTDALQLGVFIIALIAVIIKGIIDSGGFTEILSRASVGQRLEPLSFSPDPRIRFTFWGFLISNTLGWISGYGCSQMQVQRYQCCPTKRQAQRSLWLNFPGIFILTGVYSLLGIMIYASFWNCDPLISRQIQQADQIFPLYVMQTMGTFPGLPGLFVAGVYSASLSTTSSVINSLSAIVLEDYIRPFWKNLSDKRATTISKLLAVLFGGICLLIVAAITKLGSIVQATYYLTSGSVGAKFALFTLGMLIPWSNSKGTLLGVCCGLGIAWWISLGNQIHKPHMPVLPLSVEACDSILGQWTPMERPQRSEDVLEVYKISYLWITPISWFVTMIVGSLASLIIGKNDKHIDLGLYSPVIRYFMRKSGSLKEPNHHQNALNGEGDQSHYVNYSIVPMLSNQTETNNSAHLKQNEGTY